MRHRKDLDLKFKQRVEDKVWHKLPILKWFDSKKAVKVLVKNFRMNMKLHPSYVKILNSDYVMVWGEFVNLTGDNCVRKYRLWREKQEMEKKNRGFKQFLVFGNR